MYGIITIYTYIYFFIYFITGINVRGYMNIFRKEISLQNCVMQGEKKNISNSTASGDFQKSD